METSVGVAAKTEQISCSVLVACERSDHAQYEDVLWIHGGELGAIFTLNELIIDEQSQRLSPCPAIGRAQLCLQRR